MGLSNELSCEAGSFSCHHSPHKCFQSEVRGFISPLEPWVAGLSRPQLSLPVDPQTNVGPPAPPAAALPRVLSTRLPVSAPPAVWVSVSALSPWLLDFHTVRFAGSSGCFLFLNLSLSFFRLCEEAQRVYLRLHLGRKSGLELSKLSFHRL